MPRYPKAEPFHLETVKALIRAGYAFAQLRAHLKCNSTRLRAYMTENNLAISEQVNINRQIAAAHARTSIEPGQGGDEAFAKLMAGRSYSRKVFASDSRQPTHYPHRTPGDDFSSCGSSMRHSEGGKW